MGDRYGRSIGSLGCSVAACSPSWPAVSWWRGRSCSARATTGGAGDGLSSHQRERAAEVAELRAADADELRRVAEQGSGYDLAFEPGYEEVPTLVCSDDLGEVCRDLAGLGFDVSAAPPWTTADRARDGGTGTDVWLGPRALLDGSPDDDLEVDATDLAESRVAAVTRRGPGPAEECAGSATPLTCLVEAADHVTVPDPTTSAAGSAVLVALANEAGGGPEALAAAIAVLADAQVTASPIAELIDVDVPRGEVALGTDAPAVALVEEAYGEEDDLPPLLVRWSRTADSSRSVPRRPRSPAGRSDPGPAAVVDGRVRPATVRVPPRGRRRVPG